MLFQIIFSDYRTHESMWRLTSENKMIHILNLSVVCFIFIFLKNENCSSKSDLNKSYNVPAKTRYVACKPDMNTQHYRAFFSSLAAVDVDSS